MTTRHIVEGGRVLNRTTRSRFKVGQCSLILVHSVEQAGDVRSQVYSLAEREIPFPYPLNGCQDLLMGILVKVGPTPADVARSVRTGGCHQSSGADMPESRD